jgi:P-aminobenzoate N-oxygenase AurF
MTVSTPYVLSPESNGWTLETRQETAISWEYDDNRKELLSLYGKGKQEQWDAATRIDWSRDLDDENPMGLPDEMIWIWGSDLWNRMTRSERANLRRHLQAWQISQFLHGEQGALICCARIVQQVSSLDAKYYAATQVIDEARHVEIYSRFLHEKFRLVYPLVPPLKTLLDEVFNHKEWDFVYLGMQVVIEGLALGSFQLIRDHAANPLAAQINAYVMQDEARHVAFGRLVLRDYYPQLSDGERNEREEFLAEACHLLAERFVPTEPWECAGLPKDECLAIVAASPAMKYQHHRLFSRIVPTVKDIGLWGPKIRAAYETLGILQYQRVDIGALLERDHQAARKFDQVRETATLGSPADGAAAVATR